MMEKRIMREVEKNRSVLAKSRSAPMVERGGFGDAPGLAPAPVQFPGSAAELQTETKQYNPEEELTPEQIQMFEKENQDMLKHYESALDQVRYVYHTLPLSIIYIFIILIYPTYRTAEKSLVEISELQTQLVNNLATQSAHIDQLVADSLYTTENVGGGNKQLKKATERKSTAKYVFYASCGLSLFLVVWDLVI